MNQNSYYVSTATNPIELAELNVPFYTAFIHEMGCCSLYCNLWPGEELLAFIKKIKSFDPVSKEMRIRKANVVSQYEKFYLQLTGVKLI
jgi:hypothetical protein